MEIKKARLQTLQAGLFGAWIELNRQMSVPKIKTSNIFSFRILLVCKEFSFLIFTLLGWRRARVQFLPTSNYSLSFQGGLAYLVYSDNYRAAAIWIFLRQSACFVDVSDVKLLENFCQKTYFIFFSRKTKF